MIQRRSLPMRERGLKLWQLRHTQARPLVAPHAGAWIETLYYMEFREYEIVAPHAGAWIEIYLPLIAGNIFQKSLLVIAFNTSVIGLSSSLFPVKRIGPGLL